MYLPVGVYLHAMTSSVRIHPSLHRKSLRFLIRSFTCLETGRPDQEVLGAASVSSPSCSFLSLHVVFLTSPQAVLPENTRNIPAPLLFLAPLPCHVCCIREPWSFLNSFLYLVFWIKVLPFKKRGFYISSLLSFCSNCKPGTRDSLQQFATLVLIYSSLVGIYNLQSL